MTVLTANHVSCIVPASVLKHGLVQVQGTLGRSTLPVLDNILLVAAEHSISMRTTNLETGIFAVPSYDVEVFEAFETTVPAKLFTQFISKLPDLPVELSFDEATLTLHVACDDRIKASFKCIEASEYPPAPKVTHELFTINAMVLKQHLETVIPMAAEEHTNPILQGVSIAVENNMITFAALDGYKMGTNSFPFNYDGEPVSLVIPAAGLDKLTRLVKDEDIRVWYDADNNNTILFEFGIDSITQVTTRIIDGKFPEYQRFIPPQQDSQIITVDIRSMRNSLNRIKIFASQAGNLIRVTSNSDTKTVSIRAAAAEIGSNAEMVDCYTDGAEGVFECGFNVRYMIDALDTINKLIDGDQVIMELKDEKTPLIMYPPGNRKDVSLVMPMRIP